MISDYEYNFLAYPSLSCLSGSLPVSNGIFGDRTAGRLMGRIPDGLKHGGYVSAAVGH
jgi:hypothetical protein